MTKISKNKKAKDQLLVGPFTGPEALRSVTKDETPGWESSGVFARVALGTD